jgi:F5/8 type C domain-containing protein/phospholipase D-like protein
VATTHGMGHGRQHRSWRAGLAALFLVALAATRAAAAEQIYFAATDNITNVLVQKINAETVRVDMSCWYLSEHAISIALLNKFKAGVPVRLIGDRGSIFEIDPSTKNEFYWLASQGVPIRLRFNPTWFPEIDHMKATIFVGQNLVAFGSANYAPTELAPASPTNYDDETVLLSDDLTLVKAFKTKFDRFWNDTTAEPQSLVPSPPYFKNWNDACVNEPTGCDYFQQFPNPTAMTINTARLEPDNPMPADLIWGQGPEFNNRLVLEINKEPTSLQFVIYRLTVDNITNALLTRFQAGVQMQLLTEPFEYLNRKWPEFWLTHANLDKLWAAGVPIKQRSHAGLTHMKTLVTSTYASNASSNYAAAWQRDNDYFVSAAAKPTIYTAIKNRVTAMWNDTTAFVPFSPQPADAATLASPANTVTGVSTTPTLTWNIAAFATDYDVFVGTSSTALSRVGNVPAQLVNNPPSTYSWTASTSLATGTTYFWKIVSRTNATVRNAAIVAESPVWSFTTAGTVTTPPPPPSGTNIALNRPAVASSLEAAQYAAGNAVDGSTSTRWSSQFSDPQWIYVDLGQAYSLSEVILHWETAFGADYQVQVSNDASTWTTIRSVTNGDGGIDDLTSLSGTGRYVRIFGTRRGTQWGYSLWELDVRGTATTPPPPPPPPPPPSAPNIVIYASDVAAASRHGSWTTAADATSPNGVKLATPDAGVANTTAPLASPVDYVDVTFSANAATPYAIWLRLKALANSKLNDAVWVQFSDAQANGASVYPLNSTSGLLVNLATDSTAASLNNWGWQNGAYWLSQATTVTFAATGTHTMRIQVREDGVAFDQIVLSPSQYLSSPPGPPSADATIVPKP